MKIKVQGKKLTLPRATRDRSILYGCVGSRERWNHGIPRLADSRLYMTNDSTENWKSTSNANKMVQSLRIMDYIMQASASMILSVL
jgi:hypothetical protein